MTRSIAETAKHLYDSFMRWFSASRLAEAGKDEFRLEQLIFGPPEGSLELRCVLEVNIQHLSHEVGVRRAASLLWIRQQYREDPSLFSPSLDPLFQALLGCLRDPELSVVTSAVALLTEVTSPRRVGEGGPDDVGGVPPIDTSLFNTFIETLLGALKEDKLRFKERAPAIFSELCSGESAEKNLRAVSAILCHDVDLDFIASVVRILNPLLITSAGLARLRGRLWTLDSEESRGLFSVLLKTWCHHPVAGVTLCLLGRQYDHACLLVSQVADLLTSSDDDKAVTIMAELDLIIRLLETPAFERLRLAAVSPGGPLHRTLCGLLMLTPQSEGFNMLQNRLRPRYPYAPGSDRTPALPQVDVSLHELQTHFREVHRLPR